MLLSPVAATALWSRARGPEGRLAGQTTLQPPRAEQGLVGVRCAPSHLPFKLDVGPHGGGSRAGRWPSSAQVQSSWFLVLRHWLCQPPLCTEPRPRPSQQTPRRRARRFLLGHLPSGPRLVTNASLCSAAESTRDPLPLTAQPSPGPEAPRHCTHTSP